MMPRFCFATAKVALSCAVVWAAALVGCGDPSRDVAVVAAARVNGEAIPKDWLAGPVGWSTRRASHDNGHDDQRRLELLVDQMLMTQAAKTQGLDRDPQVQRIVEAAARDALARAYLDRAVESAPVHTEADVQRYYDAQPHLFAKRRTYKLQELRVVWPQNDGGALRQKVEAAKSADEVFKIVRATGQDIQRRTLQEPAERLPLAALPQLAALKPGRTVVLLENDPRKPALAPTRVLTLIDAKAAPLSLVAARASIDAYLRNERARTAALNAVSKLRASARIEYLDGAASAPMRRTEAPSPTVRQVAGAAAATGR